MTPSLKRAPRAVLLSCALFTVLGGSLLASPAASAQVPCWNRLLIDWYDGRIQNSYPLSCYQQAIDHLPADVEQYSTAAEDIAHARQLAIAERDRQLGAGGTTTGEDDVVPPPPNTNTTGTETDPTTPSGNEKKKGLPGAIQRLNPSSPDAFPLPLLILGALAILLLVAGVAGMVWNRYQGERPSSP